MAITGAPVAMAAGGGAGVGSPTAKPTVTKHAVAKPPAKHAPDTTGGPSTGGAGVAQVTPTSTASHPMVAGSVAKIVHGVAYAPANAPLGVQRAIWAGNKIRHDPYIWGGGHSSFNDSGYDCSGAVSYVLHAAGLLSAPMDSSEFMSWGRRGLGHWITVYTNPSHAFVQIAGIRFDTSSEGDPNPPPGSGPRWRVLLQDTQGFAQRHPSAY